MRKRRIEPIHPGEILLEEFLKPSGIAQYRLAKDTGVHPQRINAIVHGTGPSPPTPPYVWPATSARRSDSA